jgi:hypothetical protein
MIKGVYILLKYNTHIDMYYKVQIYFKNHSNNCQTYLYIEYELIILFELHMKISNHMTSQKNMDEGFHSSEWV